MGISSRACRTSSSQLTICHGVYVLRYLFPSTADVVHIRLATHLTVNADIAGNSFELSCKGVQLIDHLVDSDFQFENFSLCMNFDLLAEVASCNSLGNIRNASYLL